MKRILVILVSICYILIACSSTRSDNDQDKVRCEIVSIIDGDTLYVNYEGEKTKVRLIGIDAPESVHVDESKNNEFGVMASDYTRELLKGHEFVYLEFDTSMYDDYDRMLAYVYTASEQNFNDSLNYTLVAEGYAINKEFAPNTKHAASLETACKNAEENKNGLWQFESVFK